MIRVIVNVIYLFRNVFNVYTRFDWMHHCHHQSFLAPLSPSSSSSIRLMMLSIYTHTHTFMLAKHSNIHMMLLLSDIANRRHFIICLFFVLLARFCFN